MSEKKRILIVDDEQENLDFISTIVEEEGYEYLLARDGHEALELVRSEKPDLVLLDIMMPKSGVFVFKDIKNDPATKHIPVIFITGASAATGVDIKTGEQQKIEAYSDQADRGMGVRIHKKLQGLTPDGLIEKPVEPAVLVQKIAQALA